MEIFSLPELARKKILELIAQGELHPNQQIKEEEIANILNISRPPVREAFRRLEAEGIVISKPRKGVFIPQITFKDVWEIYMIKAALYSMAVSYAIYKFRKKDIEELKKLVRNMDECVFQTPPDLLKYQKNHYNYHLKILEIAGNDRLTKIASNLHLQIQRFSFRTLQFNEHLKSSLNYHRKITECICDKNIASACDLMKEHVLVAIDVFKEIIPEDEDFEFNVDSC